MRQLAARFAGAAKPEPQPTRNGGIGLQDAARHQVDGRNGRRPRELGNVLVGKELVLPVHRHGERQPGERGQADEAAQRGNAAPDPERIGPPQQYQDRDRQHDGEADLPGEARNDRQQEGGRGDIDDHHVDERRGHHQNVLLELRQQDQDDDQRKRQRRRRHRTPQQDEPEKVERAPGQNVGRLRRRIGLGPDQHAKGREMNGGKKPDTAGVPAIGGGKALFQLDDGGRHDFGATAAPWQPSISAEDVIFL